MDVDYGGTPQKPPSYQSEANNGARSNGIIMRWYTGLTVSGVCNFLLIWLVFAMATTALVQNSNDAMSMQSHIQQMASRQGRETGRAISIASIVSEGRPRRVRLCATNVYYANGGALNDTLKKLKAGIGEITSPPLNAAWYYPFDVQVDIEFNTEATEAMSASTRSLFKIGGGVKYQAFSYNVTTKYPFVSSIRLLELEFNPEFATFHKPRSIVVCSNALSGSKRCDRSTSSSVAAEATPRITEQQTEPRLKTYAIHTNNWRPLLIEAGFGGGSPAALASSPSKPSVPSAGNPAKPKLNDLTVANSEEDLYDQIESADIERGLAFSQAQEESIVGLRMYDIEVYRRVAERRTFISGNGAHGAPQITTKDEERVFTIEMDVCD